MKCWFAHNKYGFLRIVSHQLNDNRRALRLKNEMQKVDLNNKACDVARKYTFLRTEWIMGCIMLLMNRAISKFLMNCATTPIFSGSC